ncbi:MAG: hypothetical protein AAGJ81_13985 [Verrucomicrobiota bacterium]
MNIIRELALTCMSAINNGGAIYLLQNSGKFRCVIPNREWWTLVELSEELDRLTDYFGFLARGRNGEYDKTEQINPIPIPKNPKNQPD